MRALFYAVAACLLALAGPSAANAACMDELIAARDAFMAVADASDQALMERFSADYAKGLGKLDTDPAGCSAIAKQLHGLAKSNKAKPSATTWQQKMEETHRTETVGKPGKGDVISDVSSYLERVCAPTALLRKGIAVAGCSFRDRRPQVVPGPRKEPVGMEWDPLTVEEVELAIDYMAEPPTATFRYRGKDHRLREYNRGGKIEIGPGGKGLIVRMDFPQGRTGIAHLSFDSDRAIVPDLAEIDYGVRQPAEPMSFVLERDPANFMQSNQSGWEGK